MAALAMDQREPDMRRFMDTYQNDKDTRRDKFGGGSVSFFRL